MKIAKNILFAVLCLLAFGIAVVISFLLSANHILQRRLAPVQVDWDDTVGYVLYDLSYGDGDMNTYDLYVPADLSQGQPCSLILLIHGGGFTAGDKGDDAVWCRYFASKGLLCASINYTLLTGDGIDGLPLLYQETRQAVEAIYAEAGTLGFPITEMAVTGTSAGGTLALMYAYDQPENAPIPVKFVFEQVGPVSFEPGDWGNTTADEKAAFITMMTGQSVTAEMVVSGEAQHMVDAISPAAYVDEDTVPSLLAYGVNDKVVPPELRFYLLENLEEYDVPFDYIEFPNSGHGLMGDLDKMTEYVACIDTYIDTYFENF